MRLVRKLVLAILGGMVVILAVNAFVRVRAEIALFREDMQRDHLRLARALSAAAVEGWRAGGDERVRAILTRADERLANLRVRWVRLEASTSDGALVDPRSLGLPATDVAQVELEDDGPGRLVTYAATDTSGVPRGAVEIVKDLDIEARIRDVVVRDTALAAAALSALSALIVIVFGVRLVGRPMRKLVEKARRTASGDLSGPIDLPQKDEIGELGAEMNAMCLRLDEARTRIAEETRARMQALAELRHVDRLRTVGQLAAGVAHEIGTPLNVVAARAKLIRTGEAGGPEAQACARSIGEQAERISRVVRGLLDFARRSALQREPVDLREIVRRAAILVEPLAAKADVTIHGPGDGPAVVVHGDPTHLEQVFVNIAQNGIQAMNDRTGRLSIQACRRFTRPPTDHGGLEDEYACIEIQDDGRGIPACDLDRLFEPFFTTKDVGAGTGLGLAVAYGIVREHGGWIEVESEPSRGSRFSVYLPQGAEAAPAPRANDARPKEMKQWRQDVR